MDMFDLYPINYNDEKAEFFILDEIAKKLLKKKRKKNLLKEENIENLNLPTTKSVQENKEDLNLPTSNSMKKNKEYLNPPIIEENKSRDVEELVKDLTEMQSIKEIKILKKLILKYLPICKNMIDEFNVTMKKILVILDWKDNDILIPINFIDGIIDNINLDNSTLEELNEIINKILAVIRILIENYLILDNKFLH